MILQRMRNEFSSAPIGTTSAIIGLFGFVVDIWMKAIGNDAVEVPKKFLFALAMTYSTGVTFVFSFASAKLLDGKKKLYDLIVFYVGAVISALLVNTVFSLYFAVKYTSGGIGKLISLFIGVIFGSMYIAVFIEESHQDITTIRSPHVVFFVATFVTQALIVGSGLYFDVF